MENRQLEIRLVCYIMFVWARVALEKTSSECPAHTHYRINTTEVLFYERIMA